MTYSSSPRDDHYEITAARRPSAAGRQYHDDRRRDDRQSSNPSGNQNQPANVRPAITPFQGDQRQQTARIGADQPTAGRSATQSQTVTDRSKTMSYDDHRSTNRTALPTQATNARARSGFNVEDLELDRTVSDFVEIPLAMFPECQDYIKRHKAVLTTSLPDLLNAASKAAKIGEIILFKQCIQRLVLLKTCREFHPDGRAHYFEQLATPHSKDSRTFYGDCDRYEEQIRSHLEKSHPTAKAFGGPTETSRDQGIQYSRAYPSTTQPQTGSECYQGPDRQSPPAVGNSYPTASAPGSGPGMAPSRRPLVPFPSNPRSTAFEPLPDAHEPQNRGPQPDRAPLGRSGDSFYDPEFRRGIPTADHGLTAEFRPDNTAHSNGLDPKYRKQNAKTFFVPGKVFCIVLHDSLGLQQGKSKSNKTKPKDVYKGYKGEEIFGHVRRMIVCRQRQGYSLCVPINSYSNHGVADKNVNEIEKQAHAIVYPYGSEVPRPLPREPRFEKKPIAVNMCQDHSLTESSRIHFGKCHTVEHNVKVMEIGKVDRDSMADFETYCREELLR